MLSPFRSSLPVGLEFALARGFLLPFPLAIANKGSDQRAAQGNQGGQGDFGEFIHNDNLKYRLCSGHRCALTEGLTCRAGAGQRGGGFYCILGERSSIVGK